MLSLTVTHSTLPVLGRAYIQHQRYSHLDFYHGSARKRYRMLVVSVSFGNSPSYDYGLNLAILLLSEYGVVLPLGLILLLSFHGVYRWVYCKYL